MFLLDYFVAAARGGLTSLQYLHKKEREFYNGPKDDLSGSQSIQNHHFRNEEGVGNMNLILIMLQSRYRD